MNKTAVDRSLDERSLVDQQCKDIQNLTQELLIKYCDAAEENSNININEWLRTQIQTYLPDKDQTYIDQNIKEITASVESYEEKKLSLAKAKRQGRTRASWMAKEFKQSVALMDAQSQQNVMSFLAKQKDWTYTSEQAKSGQLIENYLESREEAELYQVVAHDMVTHMKLQQTCTHIDHVKETIEQGNQAFKDVIYTKNGNINQNPNLDGDIAEQYHVSTFNNKAALHESNYQAERCAKEGQPLGKNSVDTIIKDKNTNQTTERYQLKYGKDAQHTADYFEQGDYRGQQKLVPEGQGKDIAKKNTEYMESRDGTKSNALSKEEAKRLQKDAQEEGKLPEQSFEDFDFKEVAEVYLKKSVGASLISAGVSAGLTLAQQIHDQEYDGKKIAKEALKAGADTAIKTLCTAALKIYCEKDEDEFAIRCIPKRTPNIDMAMASCLAVDSVKTMIKVADGDLTVREGIYECTDNFCAAKVAIAVSPYGAALGASVGSIFGPLGAAIGSFVGGTVAKVAGSTITKKFIKATRSFKDKAIESSKKFLSSCASGISSFCHSISSTISSTVSTVCSWLGF